MSTNKHLEVFGNLIKEETLVSMSQKNLPDTIVLEAPEPFPGFLHYYSDVPQPSKPLYLYFIIRSYHAFDEVVRASNAIMKRSHLEFDAGLAIISMNGKTCKAIRVRHLSDYDHIAELQELYINEGIEFKKPEKKKTSGFAVIRIKKMFYLEKLSDHIYMDKAKIGHGYFVIPTNMKWDDFVTLTKQVRNNWVKSQFDAAMGYFFVDNEIVDMVRIYNPGLTFEYMEAIQKKYAEWAKIN